MTKPGLITFVVLWYSGSGSCDYAPNRCVGRDFVNRRDLSSAIVWACNTLKHPRGNDSAVMAQGFYVRALKHADETSNLIYQDRFPNTPRKDG